MHKKANSVWERSENVPTWLLGSQRIRMRNISSDTFDLTRKINQNEEAGNNVFTDLFGLATRVNYSFSQSVGGHLSAEVTPSIEFKLYFNPSLTRFRRHVKLHSQLLNPLQSKGGLPSISLKIRHHSCLNVQSCHVGSQRVQSLTVNWTDRQSTPLDHMLQVRDHFSLVDPKVSHSCFSAETPCLIKASLLWIGSFRNKTDPFSYSDQYLKKRCCRLLEILSHCAFKCHHKWLLYMLPKINFQDGHTSHFSLTPSVHPSHTSIYVFIWPLASLSRGVSILIEVKGHEAQRQSFHFPVLCLIAALSFNLPVWLFLPSSIILFIFFYQSLHFCPHHQQQQPQPWTMMHCACRASPNLSHLLLIR